MIRKRNNHKESLTYKSWRRFKKNTLAMISLLFICLAILISVLGYLITPDETPYANNQHLELTTKKPGFEVKMLRVRKNIPKENTSFFKKMIWGVPNYYTTIPLNNYTFKGDKIIIEEYTGIEDDEGFMKTLDLIDVLYPIHAKKKAERKSQKTVSFTDVNGEILKAEIQKMKKDIKENNIIKKKFLLGTDRFGRDLLSQLMIGTRVSLSVGFIAVFISLVVGIIIGALGGYFGGKIDDVVVWFINVVWSIPTLLLVIAITFALGKGFWQVFIAVGLTMWVEVARVVRGQIISIREKEFVEAAKALGYRNYRIISRHILPNILGPVIVIAAANFATAILIEAGLSFLGIGVQPPMPSWGTMIKEHYAYIVLDRAYLAILPGVAIMLMVLSFMLIGNGVRDALDTRTV